MSYEKDQKLFYQDNRAVFVSYLSEKMAVVIVEAFPDFDNTDVQGTCQGCLIGDSDNKLKCTCDETEGVLQMLEDNTSATCIPLVVNVNMLYEKPITVLKHQSILDGINSKLTVLKNEIIEFQRSKSKYTNEVRELTSELKVLEVRKEDYTQLEGEMSLKEFIVRLGRSIAHQLYVDNDRISIIGGKDDREFKFQGVEYKIEVDAFWEKSNHFGVIVKSTDGEEVYKNNAIDF